MDIPVFWDHFYEAWLSNTNRLLLYRNCLSKQGNVTAQPENQVRTYCCMFVVQDGTGQLGASVYSQFLTCEGRYLPVLVPALSAENEDVLSNFILFLTVLIF